MNDEVAVFALLAAPLAIISVITLGAWTLLPMAVAAGVGRFFAR